MADTPVHKDLLGNTISVGDYAVIPNGRRELRLGTVTRLGPKMVVTNLIGLTRDKMVYPGDLLVVDDPKVTMYILKHGSNQ